VQSLLQEDAATNTAACSLLTSTSAAPYYVEAGLVLRGEDTNTFNLAKQRKIREALALLMDVDAAQVTLQSIENATATAVAAARWPSRSVAGDMSGDGGSGSGSKDGSSNAGSTVEATFRHVGHPGRVVLQAAASDSSSMSAAPGSIHHMLQQERQQEQQGPPGMSAGTGDRRRQLLAKLAVPVHNLLNARPADSNQKLLAALEQQHALALPAEAGEVQLEAGAQQQGLCTAVQFSGSSSGRAAASDCPAPAGNAASAGASRQLQQLLVLDQLDSLQHPSSAAADTASVDADAVTAALAAQPLEEATSAPNGTHSAGRNSVADLLQPRRAVAALKPVFARGARRPSKVALTVSFRDAFTPKQPGSSSSAAGEDVFWASGFDDGGIITAAVPKPGTGGNSQPATAPGQQHPAAAEDDVEQEQPEDTGFTAFDALRPARSLIEIEATAHDSASQRSHPANNNKPTEAGSKRRKQGQRQRQQRHNTQRVEQQQLAVAGDGASPGYASAAAGFMESGQVQYHTRPRPRPVRPQRQALEVTDDRQAAHDSSSRIIAADAAGAAAAGGSKTASNERPAWRMMGPKTPLRRKQQQQFSPAAMHFVPQHLQKSDLQVGTVWAVTAGDEAIASAGLANRISSAVSSTSSGSSSSRQLLQTTNATTSSRAVVLVARVSGFNTQAAATASASTLEALVTNGTLRSTLAAQGWSATDIGLSFTTTGVIGNPWDNNNLRNLIIGVAAAGGVALLAIIGVLLYVRRVRSRAAAQVPGAGQHAQSYTATGTSFSPTSRPSMISGYTTSANTSYVSSSYPSASYPSASYAAGPSSPSPVMPFHPQVYMQQGRGRSNSASPVMGGAFSPPGPSMLQPAANANPFAAGGFAGGQQQQYPAAPSPTGPRSQPWADGMRRGASYSTVQQQHPQQQQQQQQQQGYYRQAEQRGADPVYPFVRPQSASFCNGQQGPTRLL
jgi:hypothetical protein